MILPRRRRRGLIMTAAAWTLGSLILFSCSSQAFVPPFLVGRETTKTLSRTTTTIPWPTRTVARRMLPPAVVVLEDGTAMTLANEVESWRQYVPLVVSLLVITDILLGSPAANAVLSIARPKEGDEDGGGATAPSLGSFLVGGGAPPQVKDSKERVDTMAVAQAALDKAAATQDLRKFLDESKSDMEKMRDVQKKLDEQLAAFDQKQLEKNKDE